MTPRQRLATGLAALVVLSGCSTMTPDSGAIGAAVTSTPGDPGVTATASSPAAGPSATSAIPTPTSTKDTTEGADREVVETARAAEVAARRAAKTARRIEESRRAAQQRREQERRERIAANKDLQEQLSALGYYDGPIDGVVGSGTVAGLRTFQAANGLEVDGVHGPETEAALAGDPVTAEQFRQAQEEARRRADEARAVLEDLGYWGGSLHHALMAFQKVNGLSPDGVLGPNTTAALADPGIPDLVGGPSTRIEADLDRQVVHVVVGGSRVRTINASSGNGATYERLDGSESTALTPVGTFRIIRRIRGVREADLGILHDPLYFHGGFALHGSDHVPAHPASHGCIRLPRPDATWLFEQVPDGTTVIVHGGAHTFVP